MDDLVIYTDGASSNNPGIGGCATIIVKGDKIVHTIVKGYKKTTNNRMEIMGVINALEYLKDIDCNATIYTDSQYVTDSYNRGWVYLWQDKKFAGRPNKDLWITFLKYIKPENVKLVWIKGHNGCEFNEKCDKLATEIIKTGPLEVDKGYEK